MKTSLAQIIENLRQKSNVDAVFLTGSQGSEVKPYSDIDLVIILRKHVHDLSSLYTWIDDKFADIFFFDHDDLERIKTSEQLSANTMDAVFVSWLEKATIQFDKSGIVTKLKDTNSQLLNKCSVSKSEKELFWQKINYNFVTNTRYFESNDPVYHEALHSRLLYSVEEVFTGYFSLRGIFWRGEKNAFKYLKEHDHNFYSAFNDFARSSDLNDKFNNYSKMVKLVFVNDYKIWTKGEVYPQSKDREKANRNELVEFWKVLEGK